MTSQTDNYGSANLNTFDLTFVGTSDASSTADIRQTSVFTFSQANAGDNFIIVAMPDNASNNMISIQTAALPDPLHPDEPPVDYKTPAFNGSQIISIPLDFCHHTTLLTVWRTLWLEVDNLQFGNGTAPLLFPTDHINNCKLESFNMLQYKFSNACTQFGIIPQTNSESIISVNSRVTPKFSKFSFPYSRNYQCYEDFWTTHVVVAFEYAVTQPNKKQAGNFSMNNVCLYSDAIIQKGNMAYPNEGWICDYKYDILAHELVHIFGYNSGNVDSWHDNEGLMQPDPDPFDLGTLLNIHIRKIQSSVKPNANTENGKDF